MTVYHPLGILRFPPYPGGDFEEILGGSLEEILGETLRNPRGEFGGDPGGKHWGKPMGRSLEVQVVGVQRFELRMRPLGLAARGGLAASPGPPLQCPGLAWTWPIQFFTLSGLPFFQNMHLCPGPGLKNRRVSVQEVVVEVV